MAARANWKGYLRLSLVSCPIALFPATSESEKVRFNQLNKNTGNRIRYVKVDAETGDEVDGENIIKGYQVSKGHYIEITDEDLPAAQTGRELNAQALCSGPCQLPLTLGLWPGLSACHLSFGRGSSGACRLYSWPG